MVRQSIFGLGFTLGNDDKSKRTKPDPTVGAEDDLEAIKLVLDSLPPIKARALLKLKELKERKKSDSKDKKDDS